jgi:N-acetylglucosamine-6-phosphate deacetylase
MPEAAAVVPGRLVVGEEVFAGRVHVEDGRIAAIEPDDAAPSDVTIVPGFIDLHVHGWGGHDAMGGPEALDGMARALARRGVTAFLPTSVTASFDRLTEFAESVRGWMPGAPSDGAHPLGFNMEGPFLAEARKGAHPATLLRHPEELDEPTLETFLEGLRVMTVAPELRGALELIRRLTTRRAVSLATGADALARVYAASPTTMALFNAMGVRIAIRSGLAVARRFLGRALADTPARLIPTGRPSGDPPDGRRCSSVTPSASPDRADAGLDGALESGRR